LLQRQRRADQRRYVNEGMAVLAAGLDQANAIAGIFGQPVGQDATRGAGARDDVVECMVALRVRHGMPISSVL